MASPVQGFEYDVFISYRHNDNQDGWVTDFVQALERELRSTIKDTLNIYFDKNPHDGLLETDSVHQSLQGKLNCRIFIPVISQTYCDPKSFAWRHEFCVFNSLASNSEFGRDIRLSNGNVSSRILPVKIHELDPDDIKVLERETGGSLRAIEFIYREAGVNRPLRSNEEDPARNFAKTVYRNQVNKVAQAIKQIIGAMKDPTSAQKAPVSEQRVRAGLPLIRKWQVITAIILVLGALSYFVVQRSGTLSTTESELDRSIAVLPFVNMSNDEDQEYFSDGLTEDITTHLAKIKALKVISRTSVMQYKKSPKTAKEIGDELGVAVILEGSVQRSGDRVRITAQLINAATDDHLWAESYDRPIVDLFDVQSDVARQIAAALKTTLSSSEKSFIEKVPTSNMEAYNLYQKAQFYKAVNAKERYAKSIQLLKQAIDLDPEFALAYAQLANAYSLVAYYQYSQEPKASWQLAKESALKAFELDSTLAASYDALAYILRTYDWNWKEAEEKWKKSIELNPSYINSYGRYSLLLGLQGRFQESFSAAQHALDLNPLDLSGIVDNARMHLYAGQLEEATKLANGALDFEHDYPPALGILGCVLEQQGKLDSSVVMINRSATRTGTDYEGVNDRFEIRPMRYKDYWREVLDRTSKDSKTNRISSMIMAVLYMRNGMHEEAMTALEKAFEDREGGVVYINVEPLFKPLHADPRFEKIVRSMGLAK